MDAASESPFFWPIHLSVAIAIVALGWRWRRLWSARFLIAAALVNILLIWLPILFHRRGNGLNAPDTPDWLELPVYDLQPFSSTLVLCIAALGLLSFLPGAEPRGRRTDKLIVRTAVISLLALLVYRGFTTKYPPAPKTPLDPLAFYPEKPMSSDLQAGLKVKQEVFREGIGTQFEVTLTNVSNRDINLAGVPYDGLRFRPYIFLHQKRGGMDLSWGSDLEVPADNELLRAGESRTFDFPHIPATPIAQNGYDEDRQILKRGDYAAFASFWIEKNGRPERVLSNVANFTVRR